MAVPKTRRSRRARWEGGHDSDADWAREQSEEPAEREAGDAVNRLAVVGIACRTPPRAGVFSVSETPISGTRRARARSSSSARFQPPEAEVSSSE